MKHSRPGVLAIRALNQYRRREILTYLALRYYLANSAARTDAWANDVAVDLVLNRSEPSYYRVPHFKSRSAKGAIEHRPLYLPCANEALAEAALLNVCASHADVFSNPDCVFSYELTAGSDRSGIFRRYIGGLQKRQLAISRACEDCPDGIVQFIDIEKFYSRIPVNVALTAWKAHAERSRLPNRLISLGEKILSDHGRASNTSEIGILTGPMFSHLIANLVLRDVDALGSDGLPSRYFRYVDDMALVGTKQQVQESLNIVQRRLDTIGLTLHETKSAKHIEVPTSEWLNGRSDFMGSAKETPWVSFVGNLKRFMLLHPEKHVALSSAFASAGYRIPVRDYTGVIREPKYLERLFRLAGASWFRRRSQKVTVDSLIRQAENLRQSYEASFNRMLSGLSDHDRYERKRDISKLRYRAARLMYLSEVSVLAKLSKIMNGIDELEFHVQTMRAISSSEIDRLLSYGTNVAQAAAQPIRAANGIVRLSKEPASSEERQALAVFIFNGIPVEGPIARSFSESELLRFAVHGADAQHMNSSDRFIREFACLHGISEGPRHSETLATAFDMDEELEMDAIDKLQESPSPGEG